jgi:predicted RNA binding protein with dsRBD fold (UPF0201 family)
MKVNLYKSNVPDHLLLKVEYAPRDVSETLKIFLCMLPSIKTESVIVEGENMVRFSVPDLTPEQIKNLKVGIINSVRELFELDPNQMSAAFLLEKQRSESALLILAETEKANLGHITQIEIYKDHIKRIHTILGWMTITTAAAILVAVVAVVAVILRLF